MGKKFKSHNDGVPWLLLGPAMVSVAFFIVAPIVFIGAYSLLGRAPSGAIEYRITFENWNYVFSDLFYLGILAKTALMAFIATLLCAVVGYAPAYFLTSVSPGLRNFLLMLIFLPSWISYVIRTMAWIPILGSEGLVNRLIVLTGFSTGPIGLLYNDYSVYVGIVQYVLPFMIVNIFLGLQSVDQNAVLAARTLGATGSQAFFTVTFPLALPGLSAGALLCFILAMGTYVTPLLLGGTGTTYYAKLIYDAIIMENDWPVGAAVSLILVGFLGAAIALYSRKFGLNHVLKGAS
ncbi:ABC transporter permease [Agrobacterium sp. ICMP 6402]|uniref:ABC transporter permease n=1 Tax=Agrobacterium sp. ICMP 6402 TaxID=2292443 RepID=UPI001294E48F|nr:ABC transporter permease [Agrobacterium sp. ICMP 6402]MQB12366.1 ABC transporter permease [Agrobacterium sp. ICMP 6402]